ncbi:MAG: hypothetical protein RL701_838, partial [Pseudomonadota bacterium]
MMKKVDRASATAKIQKRYAALERSMT